jgi:hypothetical protein
MQIRQETPLLTRRQHQVSEPFIQKSSMSYSNKGKDTNCQITFPLKLSGQ